MPWSDFLRLGRRALAPTDSALARPTPPVALSRPRGRPSWALSGINPFFSPLNRVPLQANYGLYHTLRETIPLLDAAIAKTVEFVGCPTIEAEPETKQEIEDWLNALHVNRIQTGFKNWLGTWIGNALEFGRAHTEIILTADQKDVYALMELHPATISLRPATDRYSLDIVQNQALVAGPVRMNPLLMLSAIHSIQGDDPNGTSLFWGLPFVAGIITKMTDSLGKTWERFGTPRYHVSWEPPEEGYSDPDGAQSRSIISDLMTSFQQSLQSGVDGDVSDFFSAGKVTVSVIGAEGEALDFETPMRTLTEQVVSKTGIPPFVFGLQWATTERMSAVQAALLTEMVENLRAEIHGEINYLVNFRQTISGGDTEFNLCWPHPTLLDDMDTARAALFQSQADQQTIANQVKLWEMGMATVYDVVRVVRPDLAKLDKAQIDQRLPELSLAPPEPVAEPSAAGPPPAAPGQLAQMMELLKNGGH